VIYISREIICPMDRILHRIHIVSSVIYEHRYDGNIRWDYNSLNTKLFILIPLNMYDVNYETYMVAHSKIS
jgi:hypothetical protein